MKKEKKVRTVFKVVEVRNKKNYSAVMFAWFRGEKNSMEERRRSRIYRMYPLNEWVEPCKVSRQKKYGLLAFRTIEDARDFYHAYISNGEGVHKIFKAHAKGLKSREVLPIMLRPWRIIFGDWSQSSMNGWPRGTVMCDSIKLIEEVKP